MDNGTAITPIDDRIPPIEVSKERIVNLRDEQRHLREKVRIRFDQRLDWWIKAKAREAVVEALREVTS